MLASKHVRQQEGAMFVTLSGDFYRTNALLLVALRDELSGRKKVGMPVACRSPMPGDPGWRIPAFLAHPLE